MTQGRSATTRLTWSRARPATDKTDMAVTYTSTTGITTKTTSTAPCGVGQPAVTEVGLTFAAMPDGAIRRRPRWS